MSVVATIGDISAELRSGFASGGDDPDGIVQFRMNNVGRTGDINWGKLRRVPHSKSKNDLLVLNGDILFNATNSPELVGKTALFSGFSEPVTFSNHFVRIRVKEQVANPAYIARWLQREFERGCFQHMCRSWVNQASITKDQLSSLSLPLPPLDEQRRIAAILDKADALRRKRKRALDLLDGLTQSIFLEMFGDPRGNSKGWKRGRVSDLLEDTQYGTSEKAGDKGQYPILRMGNVTNDGKMDFDDLKYIDLDERHVDKFTVKRGDILFNRTNSAELVGKTAVFDKDEPFAFAGYLVRARVKSGVSPHYISGYLNSRHGKATLRGMAKSIVGMANINAKEMQTIPIMIPDAQTQSAYSDALSLIEALRCKNSRHLASLNCLFSSLQSRAFSGQL